MAAAAGAAAALAAPVSLSTLSAPAPTLPALATVDAASAEAAPECVHPYAASFHPDLPRCAPRLSDAAYFALDRRHKRTAAIGFTVSGLGIPVFGLGLGIAAISGMGGYANGWTAFGVNLMGVGIAAHAAGAVVGFRTLGLYDREYDELFEGRIRPEDLVARGGCNLKLRPTVNGVGGSF